MKYLFFIFFFAFEATAGVEGEFSAFSNYIWRGTTFSENRPAIQGVLEGEEKHGFYASAFVSNAEFSDEAMGDDSTVTQEIDYTAGKRWYGEKWELQFYYAYFSFPGAGVFDSDEWNLQGSYKNLFLELSYMDDYFGYQSVQKYIRLGYEWRYAEDLTGAFFIGHNGFDRPKGNIKTHGTAQTMNGAGNPDYIDIYLRHRKTLRNELMIELGLNWTNRKEYSVEADEISLDDAKDFAAIMGLILPFNL